MLGIVLFLLSFAVSLRYKGVQTYLTQQVVAYLGESYGIKAELGSIYIEWPLNLAVERALVYDHKGDTLFYAGSLTAAAIGVEINKKKLSLDGVALKNGAFHLRVYEGDSLSNLNLWLAKFRSSDNTSPSSAFQIGGENISIEKVRFTYHDEYKVPLDTVIDFNHLNTHLHQLQVSEFEVVGSKVEAFIQNLSVTEQKGMKVERLQGEFLLDENTLALNEFLLQTEQSFLSGEYEMAFDEMAAFSDFFERVELLISLDVGSKVNLSDIGFFTPVFYQKDLPVKIAGNYRGPIAHLHSDNSLLQVGKGTELLADWTLDGLPDVKNTKLNFEFYDFDIYKQDIENLTAVFGTRMEIPSSLRSIDQVHYEGYITGELNNLNLDGEMRTNAGDLTTDVNVRYDTLGNTWFKGAIASKGVALDKIVPKSARLGKLVVKGDVDGAYVNQHFEMDLNISVPELRFNEYTYQDLKFNGKVSDQSYKGSFSSYDPNLSLLFDGVVNFNEAIPQYFFNLNLSRADLKALNFGGPDSLEQLSGNVLANIKGGDLNELSGSLALSNIVLKAPREMYQLKKLDLLSTIDSANVHTIRMTSDNINISLDGKINFESLPSQVHQLVAEVAPNSIPSPENVSEDLQDFSFSIEILQPTFLSKIFIPELAIEDPISVSGSANSQTRDLSLLVDAPNMIYHGVSFSKFNAKANLSDSILNASLNMKSLQLTDSLHFDNLLVLSKVLNNSVQTDVSWNSESGVSSSGNISSLVTLLDENEFLANFFNTSFVVEGEKWTLNDANEIALLQKDIHFQSFSFSHNDQSFGVNGWISESPNQSLAVTFNDFDLKTVNDFVKSSDLRVSGKLDGKATVSSVYQNPIFSSGITIKNLTVNNEEIGSGKFKANWNNKLKSIFVNGNLYGPKDNSLQLIGSYLPQKQDSNLTFQLVFSRFQLATAAPFIDDYVSTLTGLASGSIIAKGSLKKPLLKGKLNLQQTQVAVDYLNSAYFIENEDFIIAPDWMGFNYINITDERDKEAKAVGTIFHENYEDFNFDVSIFAEDFQMLNTTAQQNPYYYGSAFVSGNINISGYADNLFIETQAKTEKGTKLFIPTEGAEEVSSNEFITFVSAKNDTLIKEEEYKMDLTGIQMNFQLDVTEDAEIQLIFDETVGDIMRAKGNGNILLKISSKGDFNMYGDYVVKEGDYLFTLKNIINKRFRIREGGTITWNGDPFEAKLDLTAYYKTRSSLGDLNLPIDSSAAQRRVPVEVNLKMRNNLLSPDISFGIDLPSVDENVSAMVNSTMRNEEEVNRQVFSLLLLNRFAPPESGLQAGGAVQTTSSEMLANQLTNWLSKSKLSDYVEVGVNELKADEFEVALSKQLFNDRLTVEGNFGSTSPTSSADVDDSQNGNIVGDFNVEYKVTQDGKIRARAFRKSNDFNMVNNNFSPYTEGIGLFFREDFNSWGEFFRKVNPFSNSEKKENSN